MGIPKFFRYLSERYPLINQSIDIQNVGPLIGAFLLILNTTTETRHKERRSSLTQNMKNIALPQFGQHKTRVINKCVYVDLAKLSNLCLPLRAYR